MKFGIDNLRPLQPALADAVLDSDAAEGLARGNLGQKDVEGLERGLARAMA